LILILKKYEYEVDPVGVAMLMIEIFRDPDGMIDLLIWIEQGKEKK